MPIKGYRSPEYTVTIGRRYGTRVVTADLGLRATAPLAEVTCDCGFVSQAVIYELVNKGLGCPRWCTPGRLAPDRDRERVERAEADRIAKRGEMLARRAERRTRFEKMHETMTMKQIGEIEGLSISQVSLVLLGKR